MMTLVVPSTIRGDVPPGCDELVLRATQRDPDARYASAAAFLVAVREIRRSLPAPRPLTDDPSDQARTLVVTLSTAEQAAVGATGQKPSKAKALKQGKRRRGWIVAIAILMIAALIGAGAYWFGSTKSVAVPGIVGMTIPAAQVKLAPLDLTIEKSTEAFSETVAAGKIITTDPAPGTEARVGTTIAATVSKGQERYAVPTVAGFTVNDATTALGDASLRVAGQKKVYDSKVGVGLVIATDPSATTKQKRDTPITLLVSKGPAPVPVPRVVGQTRDSAVAELTSAGLNSTVNDAFSSTVVPGQGISSSPKAGTPVAKGSNVSLVISKGPPLAQVPDVYRQTEGSAVAAMRAAGFKVSLDYPIGFTPFGRVVTQSVAAGKSVPQGTTITLGIV